MLARFRCRGCLILIFAILTGGLLPLSADEVDAPSNASDKSTELVFFTWEDYIDPEVVADFEREFGVRVREVHYETDEVRDEVMARTRGAGFDVLLVDGTGVDAYLRRGWITPVDPAQVPNLSQLDPRWRIRRPETSSGNRIEYQDAAVPYVWGTLGIAYRRDLIGRDLDSWVDLLLPGDDLRGRILMTADSLDLIGMTLKALGHSMNSTDPDALAAAQELLLAQAPAVLRYGALDVDERSELLSGEVVAGMTYNGDAAALMEHNPDIAYTVPQEGGALWVDYLAVAASSERNALANAFIDFLNRPEVAARNAQRIYYAPANRAAEALLPESFRVDPLVYPDAETRSRCEPYEALPPEALRARVNAYYQVTQGD